MISDLIFLKFEFVFAYHTVFMPIQHELKKDPYA